MPPAPCPPTASNTCGVVVTYHPDADVVARVAAVAAQVGRVVVVDNGSAPADVDRLRHGLPGVELIANPANRGIATALNQGLARAAALGCAWALTMDQDSTAHSTLMAGLRRAYDACSYRDHLGTLAANFVDRHRRRRFVATATAGGRPYVEQAAVITSGSLVSVAAWAAVGPFRDDYFIDFVDHEFCLRLRRDGWRVAATAEPLIDHAIGHPTVHRLLWLRPATSNHPPLRRYYITRNRLVTAATYSGSDLRTCVLDLVRAGAETGAVLLLEPQKRAKAWAMVAGTWDAARGRMGPRGKRS